MSDDDNNKRPGREGPAPYESEPLKKSKKLWIGLAIAAVVTLLIGSCAWTFGGLWRDSLERQTASQEFIAAYNESGLPPLGDTIYHSDFGATQEDLDRIADFARPLGEAVETGPTSCNVSVRADTNPNLSGKLATCETPMVFEETNGGITLVWKLEDKTWKLYFFHIGVEETPSAETAPPEENAISARDILGKDEAD